jgi:hypothetical protein
MSPRRRWLLVGAAVLCFGCLLLVPCSQQIRDGEAWVYSANNLKQIGLALHYYVETYGRLPPAVVRGQDGQPLYSWRVSLLPFLEHDSLYRQFKLEEPWDGPHNKQFLAKMPKVYALPWGESAASAEGQTRYQVFVGPGTAFERDGLTWDDFPDSLADTLLAVEGGEAVPWTKPADLPYEPGKPLPPLGGAVTKPVHFLCYPIWRRPGFTACFADSSVRFIRGDTDEEVLRALITRNGGEKVHRAKLD